MSFPAIAACVIAGMLLAMGFTGVMCWVSVKTRTNGDEEEGEMKE